MLEVGNSVEFVKDGSLEVGVLIEKDVYNAKIENNEKDVIDVPYKDIKDLI